MKKNRSILVTLVVALLTSFTMGAQETSYDVKVGDFEILAVKDNINVKYVQDASKAGHVTFKSTKKVADCLIFSNNGKGKLKIETMADLLPKEGKTPVLTVYSSDLHWCENDADSTLVIESPIKRDEFGARLVGNGKIVVKSVAVDRLRLNSVTGAGTITAQGKTGLLNTRVLGSAVVDALDVVATSVNAHTTGTGTIKCSVNGGDLKVKGSGTLYYKGTPASIKRRKILGSLEVVSLDNPEQGKDAKKEEKKK